LQFTLYNAGTNGAALGSVTNAAATIDHGLFTATLDFGEVLNGSNYWLEIAVRTNGLGVFSTLSPRQPITPAPQAIYAANAGNAAFAIQATIAASATTAGTIGGVASANVAQLSVPNTAIQATGTLTVADGFIIAATLLNGGSGYTAAPPVTVSDVSGSNTVITAAVSNGVVMALTVQDAGRHYSTGAVLTIAPPPSNAYQTFGSENIFTGVNTFNNPSNTFTGSFVGNVAGSFTGNGGRLTNLNAGNLTGTATNLSVGNLTVNSNLYLPTTTATAGLLYSGGSVLMHAYGAYNFFAGDNAGNLTLTGGYNTEIGYGALRGNTSGSNDTANGQQALYRNTTGYDNTANGVQALYYDTGGSYNTGSGHQSLLLNSTGSYNIGLGYQAGYNLTTGSAAGLTNLSANAIVGGLTTNLAVLVPGGGTNTLCFTNGVLRAIQ
jgi:hypothetical protein